MRPRVCAVDKKSRGLLVGGSVSQWFDGLPVRRCSWFGGLPRFDGSMVRWFDGSIMVCRFGALVLPMVRPSGWFDDIGIGHRFDSVVVRRFVARLTVEVPIRRFGALMVR